MADNVTITAGTGTTIAADDVGAGVLVQRTKTTWGPDGTANDVDVATGKPMPVQLRSSTGLVPLGEPTDAKNIATDTTSVSVVSILKQISASVQAPTSQAVTNAGTFVTQATLAAETTKVIGTVNVSASQPGLANRVFAVDFATLTRPANVTPYSAADSISDNATAGSVTALVSGNISDVNDDPVFLSEITVRSTDTGLAGKKLRAYVFNSNPTSSTGVGGGDNAAYSQKSAGYVGSFQGYMETGFSDGSVGRLVPMYNETNYTQAGSFIPAKPVSGARTLYIQYQAVEAFTPSANSTTIIGTAKGWQARAS